MLFNLKFYFTLFFITWVLTLSASPNYKFIGKVSSIEGGYLGSAAIRIGGTLIGTSADSNGNYSLSLSDQQIKSLNQNYLLLEVSMLAYLPQTRIYKIYQNNSGRYIFEASNLSSSELKSWKAQKTINALDQNDKSIYSCDFNLENDYINLNDFVVSASLAPRANKDAPILTRLISHRDIENLSAQSLPELLEMELPGIEFTRTEGVSNAVSLNGYGSQYILFLIDGERMGGETSFSNVDYQRIDLDNVERIEIIKGGMSTLYGSGAIAGVVNVITKTSLKNFEAVLESRNSSQGLSKYSGRIAYRNHKFFTQTSGTYRHKQAYFLSSTQDLTEVYQDGSTKPLNLPKSLEIEGFQNYFIEQKLGYDFSPSLKFLAKGNYYHHERFNAQPIGEYLHEIYNDQAINLKMTKTWNTNNSLIATYAFDNYTKYDKYLKLDQLSKNYQNKIQNARLLLHQDLSTNLHSIWGIEYFGESLNTSQFLTGDIEKQSYIAAYTEQEWDISKKLILTAGLRYEHHSNNQKVFTPKLNLMYKLGAFQFRSSFASGYRSPSLKEMYTNWDHQGMFILVGNPNLSPERSKNYSLGIEYLQPSFNLSLNFRQNYISNQISTIWNAKQDTSYYANIPGVSSITGLDFNFSYQFLQGFLLRASYAYMKDKQGSLNLNLSGARPHSANLRLEYSLKSQQKMNIKWTTYINVRYLSSVKVYSYDDAAMMYYSIQYPQYALINWGLSAKFQRGFKASCGIENLSNYKPKVITYNAGISKGISFFLSLELSLDEMFKSNNKKTIYQ